MTILVLTLGGSSDPIVHAIQQNRPDRVVLLGSRDARSPTDPKVSSIALAPEVLKGAGFDASRAAVVAIDQPDDFLAAWTACEEAAAGLTDGVAVIANYTGGTKTMSAALAAFALLHDWDLQVQGARRTDLVRVTAHDRSRLQTGVHVPRLRLALRQAERFYERGDFEAAIMLLESAPAAQRASEPTLVAEVEGLIARCRFLDALDRFDYGSARDLLADRGMDLGKHFGGSHGRRLQEITRTLAWLAEGAGDPPAPAAPFVLVEELLDNAARTADRGRYDDTFSRLYRATELLAQIALRLRHGIFTARVPRERLPETFRATYGLDVDGPDEKLGLVRGWELLAELGDPLGAFYAEHGAVLKNLLSVRNHSWLAHGFEPVTPSVWRERGSVWLDLLRRALAVAP